MMYALLQACISVVCVILAIRSLSNLGLEHDPAAQTPSLLLCLLLLRKFVARVQQPEVCLCSGTVMH